MSSTRGFLSLAEQKQITSANLNSTLMFLFLLGLYSGIYPSSVYIYLSNRKCSAFNKRIVIGTLSAIFAVLVVQLIIQWDYVNVVFVAQGDSRLSIFIESAAATSFPVTISVAQLALQNIGFLLADGLMVWRCINACGRSIWMFALPMTFFVAELGLALCDTAFISLFDLNTRFQTLRRARQNNIVSASLFSVVAATSLTATSIICFHIYSQTREDPRSRRRYQYIIDIMTQSCALYTTFSLLLMIADFLNTGAVITSITALVLDNYLVPLAMVTSGLAPTLMVARLAIASEKMPDDDIISSVSSRHSLSDIEKQPDINIEEVANDVLDPQNDYQDISLVERI